MIVHLQKHGRLVPLRVWVQAAESGAGRMDISSQYAGEHGVVFFALNGLGDSASGNRSLGNNTGVAGKGPSH